MKRKLLVAGALATALTLAGCGQREDADGRATAAVDAEQSTPAGATTAATETAATDTAAADTTTATTGLAGERAALGVLNAINAHEIAAGEQALGKGVSGDVAAYARMMIDQHSANRDQTAAFNPEEMAPEAQAQKAKGDQELAALGQKDGDDYARAYVDAMVKGHTEALEALDTRLIPAATRPEVKAHLATTREHVAQHLERARALQDANR